MSEGNSRTNKFLVMLVAVLGAAVAIQGYYVFRMHQQVGGGFLPGAQAAVQTPDDSQNQNSGSGKSWSLAPNQSSQGLNPFGGSWFSRPVDPNNWDPFKEMEEMQKHMDSIFDQAFGKFQNSSKFGGLVQNFSFNPKTDITEEANQYVVRLDIPGVDKANIKVTVENGILTVSGTREEEVSQTGTGKPVAKERRVGQFERAITLPGPVKSDGVEAKCENGVLTVTIPKDTIGSKPLPIPIQ